MPAITVIVKKSAMSLRDKHTHIYSLKCYVFTEIESTTYQALLYGLPATSQGTLLEHCEHFDCPAVHLIGGVSLDGHCTCIS